MISNENTNKSFHNTDGIENSTPTVALLIHYLLASIRSNTKKDVIPKSPELRKTSYIFSKRARSNLPEQDFARIQGFTRPLFLIVENETFVRQGFDRKSGFDRSRRICQLFSHSLTLYSQGFARNEEIWPVPTNLTLENRQKAGES